MIVPDDLAFRKIPSSTLQLFHSTVLDWQYGTFIIIPDFSLKISQIFITQKQLSRSALQK